MSSKAGSRWMLLSIVVVLSVLLLLADEITEFALLRQTKRAPRLINVLNCESLSNLWTSAMANTTEHLRFYDDNFACEHLPFDAPLTSWCAEVVELLQVREHRLRTLLVTSIRKFKARETSSKCLEVSLPDSRCHVCAVYVICGEARLVHGSETHDVPQGSLGVVFWPNCKTIQVCNFSEAVVVFACDFKAWLS